MPYYIISAICLAYLLAIAFGCLFTMFSRKKSRKQKIEFIRQFKKGKCTIIYFAAIPLYWMAGIHGGASLFPSFFTAINNTMALVVLRFDVDPLSGLMAENVLFSVCVYTCFTLVLLNAMLFALSFMQERLWELIRRNLWRLHRKKLVIFGNSEENLSIYFSEKSRACAIVSELSEKEKTELYSKKAVSISTPYSANYATRVLRSAFKNEKCSAVMIINTGSDEKNLKLSSVLIKELNELATTREELYQLLTRVQIYVFGSPEHEEIYNDAVESSHGFIRYVNKYKLIAQDFINRYPLTAFMDENEINYESFSVREECDINFFMIGFGKTNTQLFLSSVANNQFVSENHGKIKTKRVKYHIFDKCAPESGKNLNHNYYRYKNELSKFILNDGTVKDSPDHLPLPELPAEEYYHELDINSPEFYSKIKNAIVGVGKYSYVSIAFGSDLENVDMAKRLLDKKLEWGVSKLYIFVKVRSGADFSIFHRDDCFPIGDEKRLVYNISALDNDGLTQMAMLRNRVYAAEYEACNSERILTEDDVRKIYDEADRDWFAKKTQFERESNIFACLSIRSKLHLMGLDITKSANDGVLDGEAYRKHYDKCDEIEYYENLSVDGKPTVKYTLHFPDSPRKTLATQEHNRWCAFMISHGFIPSTRKQIENEESSGKSYAQRRHGNITTLSGLEEYRRIVAEKKSREELETDVIKYDYQLLDDAFWLLQKSKYSIIKMESKNV